MLSNSLQIQRTDDMLNADGLYCPSCKKLWGEGHLSDIKGMHEIKSGHKPYYVEFKPRLNEHIVKLAGGKYRLLSHKGKNLGISILMRRQRSMRARWNFSNITNRLLTALAISSESR